MITITQKGNFKRTEKFFEWATKKDFDSILRKYGEIGVAALRESTPKDTGKTADSWKYTIGRNDSGAVIYWENTNINDRVNIALILQYGHGTNNGGYVKGIDYINPTIKPLFEQMTEEIWKEVIHA